MKAVAYSIKPFEKEFLAKANKKKHDITLISNALSPDTANFAEGKEAVIVFPNDDVSDGVISRLAELGIKYIATRSTGIDHIDLKAAERCGIKIANVPTYSPQAIAEHAAALALALSRHLIQAHRNGIRFDFRADELVGFNFSGKTAGIIGLGQTGRAAAKIFNGLGCAVIGHDNALLNNLDEFIRLVSLKEVLNSADIISLHVPLTGETKYLICKETLEQMKDGVMLINTSRGAMIRTEDILTALECGKVGYLGVDVYEFEKDLFFEDHENDAVKDPLLSALLNRRNVLVTPHQAFLTREALQEIANQTIKNFDQWQLGKCVGCCVCGNECGKKSSCKK
ncbi:MAG: 2-hydroxyacid dehydrogenase [Mucilaginibacter sp.]